MILLQKVSQGSEFEERIHENDIVLQYIIGRGIDCTLSLASLWNMQQVKS